MFSVHTLLAIDIGWQRSHFGALLAIDYAIKTLAEALQKCR